MSVLCLARVVVNVIHDQSPTSLLPPCAARRAEGLGGVADELAIIRPDDNLEAFGAFWFYIHFFFPFPCTIFPIGRKIKCQKAGKRLSPIFPHLLPDCGPASCRLCAASRMAV